MISLEERGKLIDELFKPKKLIGGYVRFMLLAEIGNVSSTDMGPVLVGLESFDSTGSNIEEAKDDHFILRKRSDLECEVSVPVTSLTNIAVCRLLKASNGRIFDMLYGRGAETESVGVDEDYFRTLSKKYPFLDIERKVETYFVPEVAREIIISKQLL